jgi:hypothetical protein
MKGQLEGDLGIEMFQGFWIVRLPYSHCFHHQDLEAWLTLRLGPLNDGCWAQGAIVSDVYREYWFDKECNAVEMFLSWSHHEIF